jgi:streptogramin lyase
MAELATGSVLAGYRIEGVAGRGGMGVVYRATQLALERHVALKLIAPELAQDDSFRQRFKRESRTAANIEHPHVIPVHEAGEADGELFIAMRFIEGIDMRELIRRERSVDPVRAARILGQVASALDAAHAKGLVHRDVKPGNVLIASEGGQDHAYLTDFGLSKRLSSDSGMTATGVWVGTVDYISPEQIQGAQLDARSDIYSLGCVLYHALSGRVPFERDSDVAKIFAHMSEPPPPLTQVRSALPSELDAVVRRAMAKDPDQRYPSAGDLGRAALAAAEGQQITQVERSVATGEAAPAAATRMAAIPRAGQRSTLLTVAAAAIGVAILVAVLAAAGLFSSDDEDGAAGGGGSGFEKDAITITPIQLDSPGALTIGAGRLWVTSYDSDRITGIDLESADMGQPIAVGDGPSGIAVGEGDIWVVNDNAGTVSRVDLDRGQVIGNPIEMQSTTGGDSIAVGGGKVWVSNPDKGRIVSIDPESGTPGKPIAMPDGVSGELASGEGALWVLGDHGTVVRVDPESGQPGEPIEVAKKFPADSGFRGQIAVGEGGVWVAALDDETVVHVDPGSGKVVKTIPFKNGIEGDIAVGDGSVWTVDEGQQLVRIDPATDAAAGGTLPSGTAGANDITVGGGAVWIAGSVETDTITRVAPPARWLARVRAVSSRWTSGSARAPAGGAARPPRRRPPSAPVRNPPGRSARGRASQAPARRPRGTRRGAPPSSSSASRSS